MNESVHNATAPPAEYLFQNYPPKLLGFAIGCCFLFTLVGIPGNICTIAALYRSKIHSATAIFIINLSVSDLMFCCFNIPLATSLYVHRKWIHGEALCMLYPFFRYGLVAVSIFTVLAITINRYVMIAYPRWYRSMYKRSCLSFMVFLTWLSAFVFLLPTLLEQWGRFGLDLEIGSCSILPVNGQSPKEFLFVVAFGLPCCVIIVCYARIFLIARKAEKKVSRGVKKGAKVPGPVPSASTTTTTTGPTSSSGSSTTMPSSSATSTRNKGSSRRFKIGGLLKRGKTRFKVGAGERTQNGLRISHAADQHQQHRRQNDQQQQQQEDVVEDDGTTQNYVVKVEEETSLGPSSSALVQAKEKPVMIEITALPGADGPSSSTSIRDVEAVCRRVSGLERKGSTSYAVSDRSSGSSTSHNRNGLHSSRSVSPVGPSPPMSSNRSPRNLGAGILLTAEDDKPECDRVATFAAEVLEVVAIQQQQRSPASNLTAADVERGSQQELEQQCSVQQEITAENDDGTGGQNPGPLVSCLGANSKRAGQTGQMSVNFAITSIRRTASKYKRGSFRTGLSVKDMRLLKMILTIFLAFVACYLPITTVKALGKEAEWPIAAVIANLLIYLTTCINPLIYVAMSSEYRLAYKNLLTCRSDRECSTRSSSKNT